MKDDPFDLIDWKGLIIVTIKFAVAIGLLFLLQLSPFLIYFCTQ